MIRRPGWVALATLAGCIAPPPKAVPPGTAASPAGLNATTSPAVPSAAARCSWPAGARAAVSLTYDDALASQLRYAVPVLDRHGLKATFFLSGQNLSGFAPLAQAGHELASHTVTHPCNAELAALSPDEMASELDGSIAAVHALGTTGKLTFAYPCGQTRVAGSESYVPVVEQRYRAARGVAAVVAEPQSVDLFNVPALFPPTSSDGSDVVAFVERAVGSGGWAVIGMHGVSEAGEYLQLTQPAHDKLLAYLAEHASTIYTAPFGTVADVVAACQSAAGK
jgi:peptidoglycan/xylan/chitin deacetylase (PgdA/CDA1 family)